MLLTLVRRAIYLTLYLVMSVFVKIHLLCRMEFVHVLLGVKFTRKMGNLPAFLVMLPIVIPALLKTNVLHVSTRSISALQTLVTVQVPSLSLIMFVFALQEPRITRKSVLLVILIIAPIVRRKISVHIVSILFNSKVTLANAQALPIPSLTMHAISVTMHNIVPYAMAPMYVGNVRTVLF